MALLEIVVTHPGEVAIAVGNGADRLEVCAALETGGVTASLGLLRVAETSGTPFVAMIRPRPGGFAYDDAAFATLLSDVEIALAEGAEGVVIGLLRPDRGIDAERTAEVVRLANGRDVVFHRAFDGASGEWRDDFDRLADLGVTRLLTSGRATTAVEGIPVLREMVSAGKMTILPAGGVRATNAARIIAETGVTQLHAAPVRSVDDGTGAGYGGHSELDPEAVRALRETISV